MLALYLTLALAPASNCASDWFVDVNATAPGSGTTAAPYTSIEYAIAQPSTLAGDRILVAPGTYTGETIDFLGKELSIEAEQGPGTVTVEGPLISAAPHAPGSGGQALIRVANGEGAGTQILGIDFTKGAGEDRGADAVGGTVYLLGSSLELVDCSIVGMADTRGGAVFAENSTFRATRTYFVGTVIHPEVSSPPFAHFDAGGCIWAVGSEVGLTNCELHSGVSTPGQLVPPVYGYLMWLEQCDSTLIQTTVSANQNCDFSCTANSVLQINQGSLSMQACDWSPNQVGLGGRCVVAEDATITLEDMAWNTGTGLVSGRALRARNSDTLIKNCQFLNSQGNIADFSPFDPTPGGQVSHTGSLVVEDCLFSNNGHTSGGALFADQLIVRNSTFLGNRAKPGWTANRGQGGAIFAGSATLENCIFENNLVNPSTSSLGSTQLYPTMGGALYLTGPSNIRNCSFTDNKIGEGTFFGLSYVKLGGAIYSEAPIRIFGCEFTGNYVQSASVSPNGTLTQGGALYLEQGGYIEDCSFAENNSRLTAVFNPPWPYSSQGGAVFADAGVLAIVGCEFENNSAEQGAAVFAGPSVQGSMQNTLLRANWLTEYPMSSDATTGAAWFGPMAVTQCTITEHDAVPFGGDVTAGGSLDSCIFWNNAPASLPAGVTATYSTIEGLASGLGNTTEDPLFWSTDDVRLLPASPAIDSGNSALFDADGTRSDRGAFPFDAAYCGVLCAVPLGTEPCASNPNSLGLTADIAAYGSATVSDQFLTLTTTQVPEGAFGYYLASESGGFVPLFAGSQGNLCLGGTLYRMHDALLQANSGQRVGRRVDLNDLAYGNVVLPGSTWHFQLWYRDSGFVPSTTNTSGSVQIQF